MPATLSFCKKCTKQFILTPAEMALLSKGRRSSSSISPAMRRARIGGPEDPTTWAEWVDHLLDNCPEHRLKKMPEEVEADYAKRVVSHALPIVIKADEDSDDSDREVGEDEYEDHYDTVLPQAGIL